MNSVKGIMIRNFSTIAFLQEKKMRLFFIVACYLLLTNVVQAQHKRPNILVIFSDDHAFQTISAYGSTLMQTPNIDRIAKEGALLKNVFVTNSICAPSRAVLLTGKYSHINGLRDNNPNRLFDGKQQQVQKLLHQQQYQTAWIGKWHLQSLPQGFDYWHILPDQGNYFQPDFINMHNDTNRYNGYVTDLISDFAMDWLNHRDTSRPFFLVVGEKATHRTWMPAIPDLGAFDSINFPIPANFYDDYEGRKAAADQDMMITKTLVMDYDLKVRANYQGASLFGRLNAEQKAAYQQYYEKIALGYDSIKMDKDKLDKWKFERYIKDYLATAKSLDRNIGRVLQFLDSAGIANNTIVLYTSDQGFYMGEHGWFDKRFMFEESLRTPLVIRYPGMIKPGTVSDKMIVNIDLTPSFLEMAGAPIPDDIQGKSFLPLLTMNKSHQKNEWRNAMYYHYYEYPEPHHVAPHFGVRTAQYKLIRFYGPTNHWELFDLKKDQSEMKNIYNLSQNKAIIKQLTFQLNNLIDQFKDTEAAKILHPALEKK